MLININMGAAIGPPQNVFLYSYALEHISCCKYDILCTALDYMPNPNMNHSLDFV